MALPDDEIIDWSRGYPTDSNIPIGSDIIGTNLDDQFRLIKSVDRDESVNKGWERWKGLYGTLAYVAINQFTLSGDRRTSNGGPVEVNRRVKATVTAGSVQGFVSIVTFNGVLTTVTVVMDGITTLDNGLSEVQFGIRDEALPADVMRLGNAANYAVAVGTDTYTADFSPPITGFLTGVAYYVKFPNANTGPATLNPNGTGAIAIKKNVSAALTASNILPNMIAILIFDGTNLQLIGSVAGSSSILIPMGTSGSNATAYGTANLQVGSVSTPANLVETTFFSYPLLANSLDTDGQFIDIHAWGTSNLNNVNDTIRVKFGGVVVATLTGVSGSPGRWTAFASVIRTGAATQRAMGTIYLWRSAVTANLLTQFAFPAIALNANLTIEVTGQNGTASAGEIVGNGFRVMYGS